MALNVKRLRRWLLFVAIAILVGVAGLYFYARFKTTRIIRNLPKEKLGIEIQQSTEGFSLSKSEGGRTLFTVRAKRAVAFKNGRQAELQDVHITVYGREGNRYDQIFGKLFEYDQSTGIVAARGEVDIDLGVQHASSQRGQQEPAQVDSQIHLKTSGLAFNQKTGIANAEGRIEFQLPQASGSAVGATYDANLQHLTIHREIDVTTSGEEAAHITSAGAVMTSEPRRAVLTTVHVDRKTGSFDADQLTIDFRDEESVERMIAEGNVRAAQTGRDGFTMRAPRAEVAMNARNEAQSAVFTGGVDWKTGGPEGMKGRAGRVDAKLGARSTIQNIRGSEGVRLTQAAERGGQPIELSSDAIDFRFRAGRPQLAETEGRAEVAMLPSRGNKTRTVATADRFTATFAAGRVQEMRGAPNARVVSSTPGQPDKITTSRELVARFDNAGELAYIAQNGDFKYREPLPTGERQATAERADFDTKTDWISLVGSPRIREAGSATTARDLRFNRATGDAEATGAVKTTYNQSRPSTPGGMFGGSTPIHVTGERATFDRQTGIGRYSGSARIWQGANMVIAETITFNRETRSVVAQGLRGTPITTVLVQPDGKGKQAPVTVRAQRLTYDDAAGTIRFEGGVTMRGADSSMMANDVVVYLAKEAKKGADAPSRIERALATGAVRIDQGARRATGERLVYTAAEGRFDLTGGPPRLSDTEHGAVTGASLTFWNRDARVLVDGGDARTVTRTRVPR